MFEFSLIKVQLGATELGRAFCLLWESMTTAIAPSIRWNTHLVNNWQLQDCTAIDEIWRNAMSLKSLKKTLKYNYGRDSIVLSD